MGEKKQDKQEEDSGSYADRAVRSIFGGDEDADDEDDEDDRKEKNKKCSG